MNTKATIAFKNRKYKRLKIGVGESIHFLFKILARYKHLGCGPGLVVTGVPHKLKGPGFDPPRGYFFAVLD